MLLNVYHLCRRTATIMAIFTVKFTKRSAVITAHPSTFVALSVHPVIRTRTPVRGTLINQCSWNSGCADYSWNWLTLWYSCSVTCCNTAPSCRDKLADARTQYEKRKLHNNPRSAGGIYRNLRIINWLRIWRLELIYVYIRRLKSSRTFTPCRTASTV